MIEIAKKAKNAAVQLSAIDSEQKNEALIAIAEALSENADKIIDANNMDLARSISEGIAPPILARLRFDQKKLAGAVEGIHALAALEDPVGRLLLHTELDDGLDLYRNSCPIGVVGVVFEARPDALVQISSLCLKSANAAILKGGSEARCTNLALFEIISAATEKLLPSAWLQLIETREDVREMLKLDKYIDLIIPRGSNDFVKYIMNNSTIPVLGHADGICHMYIDESADVDMAVSLALDSKTQYVSVCNALETLLVHRGIAKEFLPKFEIAMKAAEVEIRGDESVCEIIDAKAAQESDWSTEYLDLILSVKLVENLDEAIQHINSYGSRHTDVIVSKNSENAERFFTLVDSANVFHNASTRFSDGFRYGFGAEVGVSTSKIHARGPVGLEGLLIYKYRLYGHGETVAPYAKGEKNFTHQKFAI